MSNLPMSVTYVPFGHGVHPKVGAPTSGYVPALHQHVVAELLLNPDLEFSWHA